MLTLLEWSGVQPSVGNPVTPEQERPERYALPAQMLWCKGYGMWRAREGFWLVRWQYDTNLDRVSVSLP